MRQVVVAFLLLLCAAQLKAQDHCNSLLSSGLRNIQSASSSSAWDNWVFDHACKHSQSGWSADVNIPIGKGLLGIFGSQQAADTFCQDHSSRVQGRQDASFFSSLIYDKALDAWVACLALSAERIKFTPQLDPSLRDVVVGIRRTGPDSEKINMVSYEGIERCMLTGTGPNGQTTVTTASQGQALNLSLQRGDAYSLVCSRKILTGPPEATLYSRGQVTVHTTAGDLRVPFDYAEAYSPSQSAAFLKRVEDLTASLRATEQRVDAVKAIVPTKVTLANCSRQGFQTGIDIPFICKGNQVFYGIMPGQQGHGNYDFWCCDVLIGP